MSNLRTKAVAVGKLIQRRRGLIGNNTHLLRTHDIPEKDFIAIHLFFFGPHIDKLLDPRQERIGVYRWKGHFFTCRPPFGSYTTMAEDSASDSSRTRTQYVEEALAAHVPLQHVVRILRTSCLPTSTINMSNSWADESEMGDDDGVGIGGREVQQPQQRPRLQLKPRSQNPASEHTSSTSSTTTSKSNPFGAAKPREEGELIYGSSQVILVLDQHIYQPVPSTSLYISVAL